MPVPKPSREISRDKAVYHSRHTTFRNYIGFP
jgi:hypothetical protein